MKKISILMIALMSVLYSCTLSRAYLDFTSEKRIQYNDRIQISIGLGGNSGIIVLKKTVIIIDTKTSAHAKKFRDSLDLLIKDKNIILVNTHMHSDHTGGNYLYAASKIYIPDYPDSLWNSLTARENHIGKLPYVKVSSNIVIEEEGYRIRLIPAGPAHTAHDLVVYAENEKLLFAGDIFFNRYHPVMRTNAGTDWKKWITAVDTILRQYPSSAIVPGHGPMAGPDEFKRQADYFRDIASAIEGSKKIDDVRKKYADFEDLPALSSFNATVSFMRRK